MVDDRAEALGVDDLRSGALKFPPPPATAMPYPPASLREALRAGALRAGQRLQGATRGICFGQGAGMTNSVTFLERYLKIHYDSFMKKSKQPKKTLSLSQKAYDLILDRLVRHEISPGQIINRRTIASELKISIAPVLEAMVRLESEGLLMTIPRKGTQVRIIQPREITEHLVVREAIECQAARLYCGKPIIENESALKKLSEAVDNTQQSTIDRWRSEIEFHSALVRLAQCESLLRIFEQVMRLGSLCAMNMVFDLNSEKPDRHSDLINALKTTNADQAEKILRQHLRSGKKSVFE